MDYSLLIGVRRRKYEIFDRKNNDSVRDSSSVVSSNGDDSVPNPYHQDEDGAIHAALVQAKGTFYIGIIDVLQEWNWNKWSERMTKVHVLRKEAAGLSAIEPDVYRKRFIQRAIIDVFEFVDELDIAKVLQEMNKEDCKDGSNDLDGACTSEGSNLSDDSYTRYFDKKGLTHNAECLAREEFKKDNSDDEKDVEMGENSSNELFATTIERPRHGNCANTIVGVDDRFNVSPLHNDYCGH